MNNFKLPEKVYDAFKLVGLVIIPALSFGYVELGKIFGWPCLEQVSQASKIVITVLGMLIGWSSHNFWQENTIVSNDLYVEEDA